MKEAVVEREHDAHAIRDPEVCTNRRRSPDAPAAPMRGATRFGAYHVLGDGRPEPDEGNEPMVNVDRNLEEEVLGDLDAPFRPERVQGQLELEVAMDDGELDEDTATAGDEAIAGDERAAHATRRTEVDLVMVNVRRAFVRRLICRIRLVAKRHAIRARAVSRLRVIGIRVIGIRAPERRSRAHDASNREHAHEPQRVASSHASEWIVQAAHDALAAAHTLLSRRSPSTSASRYVALMTTILITGANKGLGFEAARRLIALGHTVYMGARDRKRGEEAAKRVGGRFVQLDVTDDASVSAAAEWIAQQPLGLDVLINNAGIAGGMIAPPDMKAEAVRDVYETNVFGIVRVTHAMLPLLRSSKCPVIVNVASGLGSFGTVHDTTRVESKFVALAYCSSKSAVTMLTVQYAKSLPEMRINVVDPGYTATDLNHHSGPQTVEQGTDAIVRLATVGTDGPTGTFQDAAGILAW